MASGIKVCLKITLRAWQRLPLAGGTEDAPPQHRDFFLPSLGHWKVKKQWPDPTSTQR